MTTKKKKLRSAHQVSVPDLLKLAEEQLSCGQAEEALKRLRLAESELRKYQSPNSAKKVSIPPHIVAAQSAISPLLARALFAHSFTVSDSNARLAEIEEALRLAPEESRYLVGRGACRLLMGDVEAARSDFLTVRERWPEDLLAVRALALTSATTPDDFPAAESTFTERFSPSLVKGLRQLASGEAESARRQLSALPQLDHNPSFAEAATLATQLFYNGEMSFVARDYKAAGADFKEASRLAQTQAIQLPWRERLGVYYHKIAETVFENDLSLAIECWQQALWLAPEDEIAANNLVAARRLQAWQSWREGKHEHAAALWQEALSAKPQDEQLLRSLALACEKLGRKKEAIAHWRTLAKLWRQKAKDRGDDAGFKNRLLRLEQHLVSLMLETGSGGEEITNELEAALKLDPDNHELRRKTAEQLVEIGKPRQALKHLETIEKKQGISAELLVLKAEAFDLLYRRNDARKTFERALEIDPSNSLARRGYLVFLGHEAAHAERNGDYDQAIAICEQQFSIDQGYEPAMTHLASLYLDDGRHPEAKELMDRLLAANPQNPQKHIAAGKVYLSADLKKEAEKLFKKAIELDPSAICFYLIGVGYWENGEEKKALKHFDRAAETADIEMLLEIATNLIESGKREIAERFLQKAMKLDPLHPIPHMIKGIALMGGPMMILPSLKGIEDAARELAEAERLMIGREEYHDLLPDVRGLRKHLEEGPPPELMQLLGGLGDLPLSFLEEMIQDGSFFNSMFKPKKKKKRK